MSPLEDSRESSDCRRQMFYAFKLYLKISFNVICLFGTVSFVYSIAKSFAIECIVLKNAIELFSIARNCNFIVY